MYLYLFSRRWSRADDVREIHNLLTYIAIRIDEPNPDPECPDGILIVFRVITTISCQYLLPYPDQAMLPSDPGHCFTTFSVVLLILLALCRHDNAARSEWTHQQDMRAYDETRALFGRKRANNHEYIYREQQKSVKPNIIFVLTDDQDVALGEIRGLSSHKK